MTTAAQLVERHAEELRGLGSTLVDDLAVGAGELESRLTSEELDRWAAAGVALATHSLRSWEAAAEYFRVSPQVAPEVPFEVLLEWAETARRLAESSSMIAVSFLRATPGVLGPFRGEAQQDLGVMGELLGSVGERLRPWAELGLQLHHGNWKSIALASTFFEESPELLRSLRFDAVGELVDVIDRLAERSYQLAASCLESSAALFLSLAPPDRKPFIDFAAAVARVSWADTRLYFERGPELLAHVDASERAAFLQLAEAVTADVGRQGYPLFVESAEALGEVDRSYHDALLAFARKLATKSPVAAMAFLKSSPTILVRLTADQLERWCARGWEILVDEGNVDGAEAYFRLESARAEEMLGTLSARVELSSVGNLLRLYAKALTGEQVAVRSTEELVDAGIGWVQESAATTEGTTIYLPPYVSAFPDQESNFQCYKVYTTHQTGRIEFGSFGYRYGEPGAMLDTAFEPPAAEGEEVATATEMERFFDLFEDRSLISSIFTVAEDARVDACVSREYGGIRSWLATIQHAEAERRPDVREMGLREAFVENLLRSSLNRPDTMRWPSDQRRLLVDGVATLGVLQQEGATVQDSAEVARRLYRIATRIENVRHVYSEEQWEQLDEAMFSLSSGAPGGEDEGPPIPGGEQVEFEAPAQPEFRGDFKPELVQLLARLRDQQGGQPDGQGAPLTREQLMELLEKSVEISISEMSEGEIESSMGMFLSDIERESELAQSGPPGTTPDGSDAGESAPEGETEQPLVEEIHWYYYDEWDFRAADYRPRWCRVGERRAEEGDLEYYEDTLRRYHGLVAETRRQFELLRPENFRRIKRLEDGDEVDLDRAIEFIVDKRAGVGPLAQVYWRRNKVERDVAVAFLIDMSASTDEEIEKPKTTYYGGDDDFDDDPKKYFQWLAERRARFTGEPAKRIVDLEKESLVLIVEALEAIGDAYGIYGFSGYGRDNVEFHVIKDLDEGPGDAVRRRISKVEPIRSTRMGPAIRHTISKLKAYDAKVKLLIMVSDGRPQDHGYGRDRTEKEYAVHDTHQALMEAKRAGITPFLITVDREGHDYLKEMCQDIGYEVVGDIESLPSRLTSLYRALATS